jgi:hypothetical protein
MTDRDLMAFGKYKGKPMGEVPKDYLQWLLKQEGFADKNKEMTAYIRGDASAASEKELDNIKVEQEILKNAPPAFINFWNVAYGDRLRKQGELVYIPYLRIALESWTRCESLYLDKLKAAIQTRSADVLNQTYPYPPEKF